MIKRLVKNRTKWLAISLSLAMVFGLAGCGKQEDADADLPEFVYVPKYVNIPSTAENGYTEVLQFVNNTLYYMVSGFDPELMTYGEKYYSLDATAEVVEPTLLSSGMGTSNTQNSSVMRTLLSEDGSMIQIVSTYQELGMVELDGYSYMEYDYEHPLFEIVKSAADGSEVYRIDITERLSAINSEYGVYIQYAEQDKEGNLVISDGEKMLWVFDKDGNFSFQIPINSWLNGIGQSKTGELYISYQNQSTAGCVLQKIDMQGKTLGEELKNLPGNFYGKPMPGLNKDFLLKASSDVYEYDIATQSAVKLFSLLDCDIQGDYVEILAPLEDGRIFVYYRDWSTNESGVVFLTKTPSSEVPKKTILTLGCMGVSQSLQSSVISFNKSSVEYRINIKDYAEELYGSSDVTDWEQAYNDMVTRMNNEILTGKGTDMLLVDPSMNLKLFATKGVFEDLNTYFDSSTSLKREDLVESVLTAYTINDTLVAIPKNFAIETLVGPTSIVGEEMGWTMSEMLETARNMPEGSKIMEEMNRSYLLQILLMGSLDDFINWETGKCNFTGEEFLGVLEIVKDYPEEIEYSEDAPSWPELVKENKILLTNMSVYDTGNYLVTEEVFGQPITCIGFPNSRGTNGALMQGTDAIAICSGSKHKDAAWKFIESFLLKRNDRYSWNFPTTKSELKALMDEAMVMDYMYDENGEIMYDENGEPMQYNKGGYGWGNSDDIYYIYAATQKQVDDMMELINSTTTLVSNDTQLLAIIQEEAAHFFAGKKSAKECADIIQGRIQTYVDETR